MVRMSFCLFHFTYQVLCQHGACAVEAFVLILLCYTQAESAVLLLLFHGPGFGVLQLF